MKAEQTPGKLWQELVHQAEGWTSRRMGSHTALQHGEARHAC